MKSCNVFIDACEGRAVPKEKVSLGDTKTPKLEVFGMRSFVLVILGRVGSFVEWAGDAGTLFVFFFVKISLVSRVWKPSRFKVPEASASS